METLSDAASTCIHLMIWAPLIGVSALLIVDAIREIRPARNQRRPWWRR